METVGIRVMVIIAYSDAVRNEKAVSCFRVALGVRHVAVLLLRSGLPSLQLITQASTSDRTKTTLHPVNAHIAPSGSHRPPRDSLQYDHGHRPHVHRPVQTHDPAEHGAHHLRGRVGHRYHRHSVGASVCQAPGKYTDVSWAVEVSQRQENTL